MKLTRKLSPRIDLEVKFCVILLLPNCSLRIRLYVNLDLLLFISVVLGRCLLPVSLLGLVLRLRLMDLRLVDLGLLELGLGGRDLDHDVGRLPGDLSPEALFRVSGVGNGSDEAITVDDGVGALDDVTVSLLLAVLVVGVLVVVNVEAELVGRMRVIVLGFALLLLPLRLVLRPVLGLGLRLRSWLSLVLGLWLVLVLVLTFALG